MSTRPKQSQAFLGGGRGAKMRQGHEAAARTGSNFFCVVFVWFLAAESNHSVGVSGGCALLRPRRKDGFPTEMPMPTGNHRAYLLDQLRRAGRHDLVQAVEDGQVSAFAAATALGLRKRRPVLGTGSRNQAKRRAFRLRALGLS
jgi:hypothetical protein